METKNDSKIPFLHASVSREPDGCLTTSVYRKPTHTDQYLAYDSHLPQSVKCSIVKCLYDRAKRLVTKPSVISEEKKDLSSVLVSYRYSFLLCAEDHKGKNSPQESARGRVQIHCCFTLCTGSIGASSPLPRTTYLVRPRDTVDPAKQDGVVYRIPRECSKVYIGETGRFMRERIEEHVRGIQLARTQTSTEMHQSQPPIMI